MVRRRRRRRRRSRRRWNCTTSVQEVVQSLIVIYEEGAPKILF
jgi:hypothetical protein